MIQDVIQKQKVNFSPPTLLAISFFVAILIGTALLSLPIAQKQEVGLIDSLFTAVSAVTITGLSVVNVGENFSLFGQAVILGLIQIGGIGFMTFAILAFLSLSHKVALKQQLMAQDSLGQTSLSKIGFVAKGVLFYTLTFELLGFVILTLLWSQDYTLQDAGFYALFYSISAFNNAGFTLFASGFGEATFSPFIYLTISFLYILGGLGFLVLMDIKRSKQWKKLSSNSKIILFGTVLLNIVAMCLIWILEANNPQTLANMQFGEQLLHSWFQATVPRSSGFNSIDIQNMSPASNFVMMLLMFIGGGSLSTAGGIKVGTFIVLCLSAIAFLRRQEEVYIFKKTISQTIVLKALAVTLVTSMLISIGIFTLLVLEPEKEVGDLMFEAVSAACTVGLSRGITGELSQGSLCVLMVLMFTGRLGPLTLAYLIATPQASRVKYPSADIQIG